ncbi:MAG: hypothetical protein HY513_05165 [Candidatus Aenigmarchaeota archaeon]|nr:hypothetical protein [Candidatus Aenigmarchaeota archaeon]
MVGQEFKCRAGEVPAGEREVTFLGYRGEQITRAVTTVYDTAANRFVAMVKGHRYLIEDGVVRQALNKRVTI